MILNCNNCSARLTLDDTKLPARPFGVRCDKCGGTINVAAPEMDDQQLAAAPPAAASSAPDELLRALAQALRGSTISDSADADYRSASLAGGSRRNTRRALICLPPEMRASVAEVFTAKGYEVSAADDSDNAVRRLREDRAEVLVLATEFDAPNQGALFVMRELSALRMPERRRIFVVQISPIARTADAHAAFLASVNLVVNEADLGRLCAAFDRAEHAHQELYFDGKMNVWRARIEER